MVRARSGKFRRQFIIESIEPRLLLSKTIYVDVDATVATHDGTSWSSAFTDLQQGLASAVSGDEIHVADGTYIPGALRSNTFQLISGVRMFGGYAGDGASNPDDRDVASHPSIVSGDIGTIGDNSDNIYHVVTASGTSAATLLDGFTIASGAANAPIPSNDASGGGMNCSNSNLTISKCTFSSNFARDRGGAIYSVDGSPSLLNCTFDGNSGSYGGAVYLLRGASSVSGCMFIGNRSGGEGGGLYGYGITGTVEGCTFERNTSGIGAGAEFTEFAAPTLTRCSFLGNAAYSYGGAIATSSSPTLINCLMVGNTASLKGGLRRRPARRLRLCVRRLAWRCGW